MEFFQFHPTGIYKMGILISEAVRGEGGILLNEEGERFMERYAPDDQGPRAARHGLARDLPGDQGGPRRRTAKDYVYLDVRHLDPEVIEEKLPDVTEFARVYLRRRAARRSPSRSSRRLTTRWAASRPTSTARSSSGASETAVPGLYAAGECACVTVHGANRLGTNSLLDIVVFGRRGGAHMAAFASGSGPRRRLPDEPGGRRCDDARTACCARAAAMNAADIRAELQERDVRPRRSWSGPRTGCARCRAILGGLRERYGRVVVQDKGSVYNTELMEVVELGFLLDCAETLVAAALARDESRGGHYREDHPLRDDANWLKHSLAYREDDGSIGWSTSR